MEREDCFTDVVDVLVRVRDELQRELGLQATAGLMARASLEVLPEAEFAGLTRVVVPPARDPGGTARLEVVAGSDPRVGELVVVQNAVGAGPSFAAAADDSVIVVDDLGADPRWVDLTTDGVAKLRSLLVHRLPVPGERGLGLLVGSSAPGAFGPAAQGWAVLLATVTSIALTGAQRAEQLRAALQSRDVIGQAKGMLMQRWKLSEQAAFGVLSRMSMDSNSPLREVAAKMVETGGFPGTDGEP